MDAHTAFAMIERALEEFNAGIGKARSEQAQSEETIASVEYEMEQLRKLIAETALAVTDPAPAFPPVHMPSDVEILGEDVGRGLQRRLVGRAA